MWTHDVPAFIHLYDALRPAVARSDRLAAFLQEQVPVAKIDVRPDFFGHWLRRAPDPEHATTSLAEELARSRVCQADRPWRTGPPLPGEVAFERRFLAGSGRKPAGILYDAARLVEIGSRLIAPEENDARHNHILLTDQLFGTWDENDRRFHARVAAYGYPCIISTSGLVVALAKPKEYYVGLRLGVAVPRLESMFDGQFLSHDDSRLEEVLKGYLLQAVFHHVTGSPFCDEPSCRLFNAHWQHEAVHAQCRPGAGLCARHRLVLESWLVS